MHVEAVEQPAQPGGGCPISTARPTGRASASLRAGGTSGAFSTAAEDDDCGSEAGDVGVIDIIEFFARRDRIEINYHEIIRRRKVWRAGEALTFFVSPQRVPAFPRGWQRSQRRKARCKWVRTSKSCWSESFRFLCVPLRPPRSNNRRIAGDRARTQFNILSSHGRSHERQLTPAKDQHHRGTDATKTASPKNSPPSPSPVAGFTTWMPSKVKWAKIAPLMLTRASNAAIAAVRGMSSKITQSNSTRPTAVAAGRPPRLANTDLGPAWRS